MVLLGLFAQNGFKLALVPFPLVHGQLVTDLHCAATGRLSCREPNLQTLPKSVCHQSQCVEKGSNVSFRSFFKCPTSSLPSLSNSNDYYFIVSDFAQIELRVLADLSGDPDLIASFSNPRVDFFDELSRKWSLRLVEKSLLQSVLRETFAVLKGLLWRKEVYSSGSFTAFCMAKEMIECPG
jgi:DNA polymerase family A